MNRSINISIRPDSNLSPLNKTSIFSLNDGELEYEGGVYNPANGYISKRIRSFDTFLLAADTIAPKVEIYSPQKTVYELLPEISFKVEDHESGIGDADNIQIYFDDQYIVSEWDPERDLVKGTVHFTPTQGEHQLRISVRDRLDNITEIIKVLTIK